MDSVLQEVDCRQNGNSIGLGNNNTDALSGEVSSDLTQLTLTFYREHISLWFNGGNILNQDGTVTAYVGDIVATFEKQ